MKCKHGRIKKMGYVQESDYADLQKAKGVYWNINENKWHSRIVVNKVRINLGYFKDELSAAIAYNKAALKYFGQFAKLNLIKESDYRRTGK